MEKIVGKTDVIQEGEFFEEHRRDMADYEGIPAVVVRPHSEEQVSAIVRLANRRQIPILAWGAGSSLTGAVVREGAIVVDMKRFDRILKEHPNSRFTADAHMARAESLFNGKYDYAGALKEYEEVLKFKGNDLYGLALFKSAWCMWRLGNTDEAAKRFVRAEGWATMRAAESY